MCCNTVDRDSYCTVVVVVTLRLCLVEKETRIGYILNILYEQQ